MTDTNGILIPCGFCHMVWFIEYDELYGYSNPKCLKCGAPLKGFH